MDLATLAQMRQSAQQTDQRRHQQAEQAYKQGLGLLAAARAEDYADKAKLTDALEAFVQAMTYHRSKADPCVGAAYLFMLAGDGMMAGRYLREALDREPGHKDAMVLLESLQNPNLLRVDKVEKAPEPQRPAPASPDEDDELDAMYDQAESLLRRIRQRELAQPRPMADADSTLLKQRLGALNAALSELDKLLGVLENEFDTSELCQGMNLLESRRKGIKDALDQSLVLLELGVELDKLLNEVTYNIRLLQSQPDLPAVKKSETELEVMLDHCDLLADQLDAMEQQGLPTAPQVAKYENLVAQIAKWQDQLDEVVPKG